MILAALLQMNPMVLAQQLQVDTLLGNDSIANRPLILMTALAGLALVPFVLMMVTSFCEDRSGSIHCSPSHRNSTNPSHDSDHRTVHYSNRLHDEPHHGRGLSASHCGR